MRCRIASLLLSLICILLAVDTSANDEPGVDGKAHGATSNEVTSDSERLFVRRIAPLLREKCVACHGADGDAVEGSLDLTRAVGIATQADSGEISVQPGAPLESPLYLAITRDSDDWSPMPPKESESLSGEQLQWVRVWIETGAVWPSEQRQQAIASENEDRWSVEDGVKVLTSGGLSAEWTNRRYDPAGLWAYRSVAKPSGVKRGTAAIDAFLDERRPNGLPLAPAAQPGIFIRRATFDLTGLPPTPEEIAEFEVAYQREPDAAVDQLLVRLLDSPHYGERMAQHWLDVVRYADSSGFANDYERGNAWRYRDYVIRAFNQDKPYNGFIVEQIAGDEMTGEDVAERIIATGFLRMGPWELTGMEVAKVARQRFLDDVTNGVGETFMAHSLQCARCHDHKFDPVPTRDYYAIQSVFATTQLAERAAGFLPQENRDGFEERSYLEMRRAEHLAMLEQLDQVLLENAQQWYVESGKDSATWNTAVETAKRGETTNSRSQASNVFNQVRSQLMREGMAESEFPPKLVGFTPEQFGMERVARKGLERLRWESDRYAPFALAVYSGRTPNVRSVSSPTRMPENRLREGELEATCILSGGDPFSPAEPVQPGVLSAVRVAPAAIPDSIEGRRLAFANWLADPNNPLTTRAIVNRIWMWHFNDPIAGNPNNFGSTGKRPTHPELLDWLAATFVEEGWSFKRMHHLIMSSAAYRRSCDHPDREQLETLDPQGTSYAVFKPRRLSAEELRDAMLATTGELNRAMGGIPARPEINLEAALQPRQVMGTFAAAWTPNALPSQRHRRSIYTLKLRGLVDPALEVFNAPAPDFSCERRDVSTVTPQVFAMFNSEAGYARAVALAHRVLEQVGDHDIDAITRCFQLVYGRSPTENEVRLCLDYWRQQESFQENVVIEFTPQPTSVRREAVEENTGEKFSFEETLYANSDFIPDRQPSQCDTRTRALADVCLALLNSNEFAYVY